MASRGKVCKYCAWYEEMVRSEGECFRRPPVWVTYDDGSCGWERPHVDQYDRCVEWEDVNDSEEGFASVFSDTHSYIGVKEGAGSDSITFMMEVPIPHLRAFTEAEFAEMGDLLLRALRGNFLARGLLVGDGGVAEVNDAQT